MDIKKSIKEGFEPINQATTRISGIDSQSSGKQIKISGGGNTNDVDSIEATPYHKTNQTTTTKTITVSG